MVIPMYRLLRTVNIVLLLMFILLNITAVYGVITVSATGSDFRLIGYGWRSPTSPDRVYPGSSKVSYYVSLMYVSGSSVVKVYAELYLPQGITTFSEGSRIAYSEYDTSLSRYDVITLGFSNLNISKALKPGTYKAELRLTYVLVGGIEYGSTVYVPMVVSEVPQEPLELVDYYWSTRGGLRRSLTPGFGEVDMVFYLRVRDDVVIRNIYAVMLLPEGLSCGDLRNATSVIENIRYVKGDLIELRFNYIDVSSNVNEGEFNLTIYLNSQLDLYGLTTNVTQYFNVVSNIDYVSLRILELVDLFWGSDRPVPVYPNTSKASLSVVLMNVGTDNIYGLVGRLLLPRGFTHIYGDEVVNNSYAGRLGQGSTVTLIFDHINLGNDVRPGNYQFKLVVEYFIDFEGSSVRVSQEYNLSLQVLEVGEFLSVISVRWNNEYGVAFPGSRGELEVTLSNWGEYAIDLIEPTSIDLPSGFKLLGIRGDCLNSLPPYSTCSLILSVDVDTDVMPGSHKLSIGLRYLIRIGSSDIVHHRGLTSNFMVTDPELFGAKLQPAAVLWGDTANPREALPGSRLLPLTVELVNIGRDVATGVIADIELPSGLMLAYPGSRASCDRVERGGSCTLRYYVNVDRLVEPDIYKSKLTVKYVTYFSSANLSKVESFNISLPISRYPRELKLYVVEANWSNSWPAYPGDRAVFNVRLANLGPYAISSVISRLELPKGFRCDSSVCESYFSGPLQQYQQFNTSFKVLVGRDVEPGTYRGGLTLDYVVQTGGYGIRLTDVYDVDIYVSNVSDSMRLVGIYWVNTTPSKGDVGLMRVILRCDGIYALNGLVLTLNLPEGMVAVPNNSSKISIPYYQQLQLGLGGLPAQIVAPTEVAQGDIIYVDLPVRVLEVPEIGATLTIIAEFLDHWNSLQEVRMEAPIYILSKSRMLDIEPVDNVVVAGKRFSEVSFRFLNLGDSHLYNLVVFALSPYSGISFLDPVRYIDSLGGGNAAVLRFKATANPGVLEGPYPALFTVVLQDFSGRVYTLNLTSALIVKGLEAVRLLNPQINPETVTNGSTISFSATIINEGRTPLRHMTASLESEILSQNSTYYIGNVDPDSQIPISLRTAIRGDIPSGNYCMRVLITYYDVFHELRTYEEVYCINVIANLTPTQTPQIFEIPPINLMVLAGVIAFVISVTVFYLLWFKKKVGRSDQRS